MLIACVWRHVQVAGVEGRHIVLLLADNNTDPAMLADVNGLLNTGDVTGGCAFHTPSCHRILVVLLSMQLLYSCLTVVASCPGKAHLLHSVR